MKKKKPQKYKHVYKIVTSVLLYLIYCIISFVFYYKYVIYKSYDLHMFPLCSITHSVVTLCNNDSTLFAFKSAYSALCRQNKIDCRIIFHPFFFSYVCLTEFSINRWLYNVLFLIRNIYKLPDQVLRRLIAIIYDVVYKIILYHLISFDILIKNSVWLNLTHIKSCTHKHQYHKKTIFPNFFKIFKSILSAISSFFFSRMKFFRLWSEWTKSQLSSFDTQLIWFWPHETILS